MCGIVDANVANEVFGDDPSPAGKRFFETHKKLLGMKNLCRA